jgi:hypothetical protein
MMLPSDVPQEQVAQIMKPVTRKDASVAIGRSSQVKRFGQVMHWGSMKLSWMDGIEARYLIHQADCCAGEVIFAQFVESNSVSDNIDALEGYIGRWGLPEAFQTNSSILLADTPQRGQKLGHLRPTTMGRVLHRMNILAYQRMDAPPAISLIVILSVCLRFWWAPS